MYISSSSISVKQTSTDKYFIFPCGIYVTVKMYNQGLCGVIWLDCETLDPYVRNTGS